MRKEIHCQQESCTEVSLLSLLCGNYKDHLRRGLKMVTRRNAKVGDRHKRGDTTCGYI